MAPGDGQLFPRGGVWWAAFCSDGVEKRESLDTRDEAEAWGSHISLPPLNLFGSE